MTARPLLTVDTGNPTPPYEQLRRQLTELIQSAALAPGDRLPPLRQLAADLGLAVGTVARAYRELESAGLVSSRRGGGTRVSATAPSLSESERQRLLRSHARTFVQQATLLGADEQQILDTITQALATWPGHTIRDIRYPADPGPGHPVGPARRTQIIPVGAAPGSYLSNQVAEQIGGSFAAALHAAYGSCPAPAIDLT